MRHEMDVIKAELLERPAEAYKLLMWHVEETILANEYTNSQKLDRIAALVGIMNKVSPAGKL